MDQFLDNQNFVGNYLTAHLQDLHDFVAYPPPRSAFFSPLPLNTHTHFKTIISMMVLLHEEAYYVIYVDFWTAPLFRYFMDEQDLLPWRRIFSPHSR